MAIDFFLAALDYFQQGYTCIPLGLDAAGFPKRPIPVGWTQLPHRLELIQAADWGEAKGIGIVLGPSSGNLGVIDLDDVDLAECAAKWTKHTRTVRTVRGRAHVYVKERTLSKPRSFKVLWHGKQVQIELKCQGTQVACPPTPGYSILSEADPKEVENIGAAWMGLARCLGIEASEPEGYPKAWRDKVSAGERNKSAYVEAHFLRQARMPLDMALRIMELRWQADYEKGEEDWAEVARTIESAYAKGWHAPISDVCADRDWT